MDLDLDQLLAEHLQAPSVPDPAHPDAHADDDERLSRTVTGLDPLVREVAAQVASLVAVSLLLTLPAGRIVVGLLAPDSRSTPRPVLASLAVPLRHPRVAALLVLQAADAGAFLLLVDGLHERLGAGRALGLDQHLDVPVDVTGRALRDGLDDLRPVDQAVGALIEQGRSAQEAHRELRRRAEAAQTEVPALARTLLAGLRRPPAAGG